VRYRALKNDGDFNANLHKNPSDEGEERKAIHIKAAGREGVSDKE
jgi:hypothetical protein